jgi:hypothetical protein
MGTLFRLREPNVNLFSWILAAKKSTKKLLAAVSTWLATRMDFASFATANEKDNIAGGTDFDDRGLVVLFLLGR